MTTKVEKVNYELVLKEPLGAASDNASATLTAASRIKIAARRSHSSSSTHRAILTLRSWRRPASNSRGRTLRWSSTSWTCWCVGARQAQPGKSLSLTLSPPLCSATSQQLGNSATDVINHFGPIFVAAYAQNPAIHFDVFLHKGDALHVDNQYGPCSSCRGQWRLA